ncbi:MAG: BatA domain-containing protein, partial [Pirellula sp.]|nr:BatA domain-containing protein [Pirellula sp.]
MGFLAPFYALAGLAIIAPIIAHLVRKRPKDRIEFSSSLFLEKDAPRLTKSSQIDQWWLLAVRSLLVLLVAAAFARPYWNTPIAADSARNGARRLVMIDVSASMKRSGLMEVARTKSIEWIESATPEDLVSVYAFHRELVPLFSVESSFDTSPEKRQALAKQSIDGLETTWFDTNFGSTIRAAVELLSREAESSEDSEATIPSALELVIVSDFQQGGQFDELASIEWPKGLTVRQVIVSSKEEAIDNAFARVLKSTGEYLESEESTETSEDTETERSSSNETRVRVSNSAQSRVESLKLGWTDQQGRIIDSSIKDVLIPPGQTRNVNISAMPNNVRTLRLMGDKVQFDNEYYCSPVFKQSYRISCLTNHKSIDEKSAEFFLQQDEKSAEFFLQQLPLGSETYNVEVRFLSLAEKWTLDPKLEPCAYVIGLPEGDSLTQLRSYLEQGGSVFWLLDNPVSSSEAAWNTAVRTLSNDEILGISEGVLTDYRLLQDIDFADYLFSDLADSKFSDFTKVRFWKQRNLELRQGNSLRVLAHFDHGQPAIIRKSFGKGELLIMAAGWQPEESQFALSSKFLPLMLRYIQAAIPEQNQMENLSVGGQLEIVGPSVLTFPDGTKTEVPAGKTQVFIVSVPGNYVIQNSEGQNRNIS